MKDKENEENMNMNYHNYKMHVPLFQINFCSKITNVQGQHRVSKENTVYIK